MAQAAQLSESTGREVSLRRVLDGELVVVRGGLEWLGAAERMHRAALDAVAASVSREAAEHLAQEGLEQLHTVATVEQIRAVRDRMDGEVRAMATTLLLRFGTALAPQGRRLYVSDHLGVRIMAPTTAVDERAGELSGYTGFLIPTDAHVDSWFNTAVNSVNLWMAVSGVRRDNGLLLWPQAYRSPLRHDGVRLLPGQPIGSPVEVELDPGDLLLFAGDQLHATRPNTGDRTRWVVTKRICLGPPRYHPHATGWVPYLDPRLLGTPLSPLAPLRSVLTAGRARQLGRDGARWCCAFGARRRAARENLADTEHTNR
ncbi:phytanoyl-CoA dioxygenase family protein [Kitasatospora mediocidica]|uniref:phytanoyl-CoA dioxygenase family protein n=1 Tax=Kitasatospora mediocidica TaxID=58352 RepID=UPI00056D0BC9|nr:phytanoyl-CoA dioxygenase family protein [Kitasatospora mediocidica]